MTFERRSIIKLYLHRLINSLVPPELGDEYVQSMANALYQQLINTHNQGHEISTIINKYKTFFLSNSNKQDWEKFQEIITALNKYRTLDQISNYLVFMDELKGSSILSKPDKLNSSSSDFNVSNNKTLSQLIEPYYESLSEDTILTYLPYTLMGMDSKLFQFTRDGNSIEIPKTINNSYSSLLKLIFEYSLLYKRLLACVEINKGKMRSAIKSAYFALVEDYLKLYSQDINELFVNKPSSILFVYTSIFDWIFKLRFLYRTSLKMENLDGDKFLTYVHKFTEFGDQPIKEIALKTFDNIVRPYYNILEFWLIKGELIDQNDEFFISFDVNEKEFNKIIKFHSSKVPSFIQSPEKVFQIGKTLIFLNKYCKELQWINNYNSKYSTKIYSQNDGLASMGIDEILEIIDEQYRDILNTLTLIIHSKNKFFDHLTNFKTFYFMGVNEFTESLIIKGESIFNEKAIDISSSHLHKILFDAVQVSSIKKLSSEYLNRLDTKIFNSKSNTFGWESFLIDYRIDDLPFFFLLEDQIIQYLKIFHFFWKIRHLQILFNSNYQNYMELGLKIKKIGRTGELSREYGKLLSSIDQINIIRNHFIKFLQDVVLYLTYEVIEESFNENIVKKFYYNNNKSNLLLDKSFLPQTEQSNVAEELEAVKNVNRYTIDELITIHGTYLGKIVNTKLLDDSNLGKRSNISFVSQIHDFLQIFYRFINLNQEYLGILEDFLFIYENNLQGNISNIENELDEILFTLDRIFKKLKNEYFENEYKCLLVDFKEDLKLDNELKEFGSCL
ncbi:SPC98 [Candida pseudojiufengensis]|uniref:SPC98 n=1 Tax=Candida pseudojiufengensis TaxID=497109 RepID=UPI00222402AE|nr:SPC98 [Candida pseudojiufengensis]KAI5963502.1 SPC98 [Candida pseudojiufengensis]